MQTRNTFRALMICVAATAMLAAAPVSQAKPRHHRGASPDRLCTRAAQSTDLTADQKAAVAVNQDFIQTDRAVLVAGLVSVIDGLEKVGDGDVKLDKRRFAQQHVPAALLADQQRRRALA